MSCEACRIKEGAFAPDEDWKALKRRFEALVDAGKVQALGIEDPCSANLAFGYQCESCGQVWRLCVPDDRDPGGCFEAG